MKLTNIKNSLNEISAIGGLKQVVKGNTDRVEGIKLSKEMAQAMIDWFNSSPYGRKYPKAAKARLHLSLGIMSSMGLDRYAKHKGAKEELKYIKDLSRAMRDNVNEESLNERDDAGTHLDRLADLVGKAKDFFAIGKELDKGGYKKKYFYSSTMMPMYQIEIDGFKFGIVNKRYVDKGDREVGSTAIGLMESMKMNEAKYDIGMARKGNGLTIYNKAEEEAGDYKNVAHIDTKGKIKYYDKKLPSKIKKQIEAEAKKMMEAKLEGTMKLKDLLNESFENMKVYSNPFHSPFVKENDRDETTEMTTEQKGAFLEAVKAYTSFGETVYRKEGLEKVYESIRNLVETAGKNMVKETEGSFDGITVGRHVKRMNESFRIFEKTLREVHTLQQRLESTYDEIGEVLGKYYEINEVEEKVEEGNEFGAARAKAIANGDSEFEVDGKKYKVTNVDKDDKENAKKFANESKSMKLTSMLNEASNDEALTDKEQELVRKSLQRAVGVRVDTDVSDLRYNSGTSEFIFDGGQDMMLFVGYDENDEEYNVSVEHFEDGQIAQKNTKDLKSAIKVAMQMAKKYKKRLTTESKSMKLTSMLNESFGMGELPSEKLMKMKVSAKDMMDSVKNNKTTKNIVEGYSTEEKRIVLLAVRKLMKYKNIDINLAAHYVVGAAEELKMDIDKGRVKK
jgi:hypothetical protein